MKSPITGKEMRVIKEMREMFYRKESFQVVFHCYQCEDTSEQFEDDHFSQLNFNQVINQYRVRHHIPFPEQILEIRLKYNLSAARMSEILGMGANSWRNYEVGEVPSKANAGLIQLISKPEVFEQQIQLNSELEEQERGILIKRIQKLKRDNCITFDQLSRFQCQPDITTGFKAFDPIKTKHTILYFAGLMKPFKTKLNKILFYTDFVHFRGSAQSLTGLKYAALPYGPVPNNFEFLFDVLEEDGIIKKEYSLTNYEQVEKILPSEKIKFDSSLFSSAEIESMEYIAGRFRDTSASEIVNISHQEPAWKENIEGNSIIPYHYAYGLVTV